METVNIALPEALKQFLDQQVSAGVYSSVSDYIRALVQEDQKRKAQETIETLILEGLNSEASEMTAVDWAELKQRVWDRHAAKS
jgi:antitoxin ParD1/3/4